MIFSVCLFSRSEIAFVRVMFIGNVRSGGGGGGGGFLIFNEFIKSCATSLNLLDIVSVSHMSIFLLRIEVLEG